MPVAPCQFKSLCQDPANPLTNYSTEAGDNLEFLGWGFPWIPRDNPTDDPKDDPPSLDPPPNVGDDCASLCRSPESDEAAVLCSDLLAWLCAHPGIHVFYNEVVSATINCPDGSPFTFTVPAGSFAGPTQAGANAVAQAYANNRVRNHMVCLSDIPTSACLGKTYAAAINTSRTGDFTFTLVSGSLPPGISTALGGSIVGGRFLASSIALTGTPTLEGTFTFTIRATDSSGDTITRQYTICVIGPATKALPDGAPGIAYTTSIVAAACTGSQVTWTVSSGTLPPGLKLNSSTGVISGTPTTAGNFSFTVTLTIT